MASSMASLTKWLLPPKKPEEAPAKNDWVPAESLLGTDLPADYKQFVGTYGTGWINKYLHVMNPFSAKLPWMERLRFMSFTLHLVRRNAQVPGARDLPAPFEEINGLPYPVFPEPGGLLPWGYTINGDALFWLTKGTPDKWTVVADSRGRYAEYAGPMSAFLHDVLSERISWGIFQAGVNEEPVRPTFTLHEATSRAGKGK
ncbi:hypothetical protein [Polyangium sp. y55x31]|uniref:hypothetical protein n=1 Tax=Polyangium sp. y55x31 TaxID=3042688 RepID=UPI0024824339|nr:hypothetical protein [Polyangium sp. y55x31]MDI1477255.1 hypothetical protein [Polyangium sp. y55x31]